MNKQSIILAGGCFWCTEAVFKRLKGVLLVTSGYSGGELQNPTYEQVTSGETKHAESIKVVFDADEISLEHLLEVFWHTHNPTELNRQGSDVGTQYRSAIFYFDDTQKAIIDKSLQELKDSKFYKEDIVTEIKQYTNFYPAEEYHSNYYENHTSKPYCTFVITPKISKLMDFYKKDIKNEYSQTEVFNT